MQDSYIDIRVQGRDLKQGNMYSICCYPGTVVSQHKSNFSNCLLSFDQKLNLETAALLQKILQAYLNLHILQDYPRYTTSSM